jgi:hypothetical protein
MIPFKYGCFSQSYSVDSVNHLAVLAVIPKKGTAASSASAAETLAFSADRSGINSE